MMFMCSLSFEVEVVGDGEPSDSGWEFGSECGSVVVSGVPVATNVGKTAPTAVTVMCEGVPLNSEWDLWNRSRFFLQEA